MELVAVRYQGSLESYTSLQRVFGAQSLMESIRALLLCQGLAQVEGQQSKLRLEIRRLEELKVFNSLRLSVVVLAEVLPEVFADVAADVAGRTELVRTELVAELVRTELLQTELLAELLAEVLAEILEAEASLVVYYLGSSVS